jgi:hypothetical protein
MKEGAMKDEFEESRNYEEPEPEARDEEAAGEVEATGEEEEAGAGRKRERYRVAGEKLVSEVKKLVREGNVRRIIIRNEEDRTLIEIPLTIGVVGAALFPVWAAVGAIAALVTSCSIEVEREVEEE